MVRRVACRRHSFRSAPRDHLAPKADLGTLPHSGRWARGRENGGCRPGADFGEVCFLAFKRGHPRWFALDGSHEKMRFKGHGRHPKQTRPRRAHTPKHRSESARPIHNGAGAAYPDKMNMQRRWLARRKSKVYLGHDGGWRAQQPLLTCLSNTGATPRRSTMGDVKVEDLHRLRIP